MTIYLAADHAGFELKEAVKKWLANNGYQTKDLGALKYDEKDDYPDFMHLAGKAVSNHPEDKAIVFGGSGQGEAIVCNRYKNVRAAAYYGGNGKIIKLSREHNDANALALGARVISEKEALEAVKLWLDTKFSNEERHKRRIEKIDKC